MNNNQLTDQPAHRIDPWVRLHYSQLLALRPQHLYSTFDPEISAEYGLRGPACAGETEWSADGPRQLSFGWDWYWDPQTRLMLANWQHLRTNILLVDDSGRDLSAAETYPYVEQLMSVHQWQQTICMALDL